MILTGKTIHRISRSFDELMSDRFDGRTFSTLFMDIREVAKSLRPQLRANDQEDNAKAVARDLEHFADVCDFIAHPTRDTKSRSNRNLMPSIGERILKDARAVLDCNTQSQSPSDTPAITESLISVDSCILGVVACLGSVLLPRNKNLNVQEVVKFLLSRKSQIALCIADALDGRLYDIEKRGLCVLQVLSYEGEYRLYCCVSGPYFGEPLGGGGFFKVGFPVMLTGAKDIDHVLSPYEGRSTVLVEETIEALDGPYIETYRGDDGLLHVRRI